MKLRHITTAAQTVVLLFASGLTIAAVFLALSQWRLVPVLSGSMQPLMAAGDLAITRPIPASDIVVGDVIAYRAPVDGDPLIIHRVVDVEKHNDVISVKTRGDANSNADEWRADINSSAIVWRREMSVTGVGLFIHLAMMLGTPTLLTVGALLTFAMVTVAWIWRPGADVVPRKEDCESSMAT